MFINYKKAERCCLIILSMVLIVSADRVFKYPRVQQEKDQWCWSACSQWIIGFHGTNVSQTDICKYGFVDGVARNYWNWLYTSENGMALKGDSVYGRGINCILKKWGVNTPNTTANTLTEADFKKEIDNGHPFIVRYQWDDNSGHFTVAMGYQNGMCWLMNPWKNDGIQIYNHQWVLDNKNGPLSHHIWSGTLKTQRNDTIPKLTTVFPVNVQAGEVLSLKLSSELNGRDVTNNTFFTILTPEVAFDSASRTISWTQTANGPATIKFIREFGNARDTITKNITGTTAIVNRSVNSENVRIVKPFTISSNLLTMYIPSNAGAKTEVAIYTSNGQMIDSKTISGYGIKTFEIDKIQSRGVYLVRVVNDLVASTQKITF